jgi:hypothetical protein
MSRIHLECASTTSPAIRFLALAVGNMICVAWTTTAAHPCHCPVAQPSTFRPLCPSSAHVQIFPSHPRPLHPLCAQLCLKFTFERIKGQPRLPVRAAPATATSNIARMARRPVFVNLLEPDERPRVWARSPTPDDTRAPGGSWGRETREEDSSMRDMADDGSQASDGGWDGARNGGWEGTMGGAHAGRMPQAPGGAREGATSGGWEGARNEGRDDAPGGVWESAIGGAHAGRLPQRPSGGREGGGRESGGREGARGDGTSGARAGRLTPPRARERPRMPTARRAARGFPRAGVIGSPSAPRLGPTVPSHGYRRQVRSREWA